MSQNNNIAELEVRSTIAKSEAREAEVDMDRVTTTSNTTEPDIKNNWAKECANDLASTGNNAKAGQEKTGRFWESYGDFAMRLIFRVADFAIALDKALLEISRRAFKLLPESVRQRLIGANDLFKAGRNRVLGMQRTDVTSKPGDSNRTFDTEYGIDENELALQRGDVPGWVLVVLMTTGLVTALWAIAAPRLSTILKNSLDSMNSIR